MNKIKMYWSCFLCFVVLNVDAKDSDTTLQSITPYFFGAAISSSLLKTNPRYLNLVNKQFNSITAENEMKFSRIHPAENTYTWDNADSIVAFAQRNNKRIHGHTLIWHDAIPTWLANYIGDSAAWENIFKTHIQTVVNHYKGKVTSWDVVNEAIDYDGSFRNTIWSQHLGNNYIARAFIYAHEADPAALLFYNDNGHDNDFHSFVKLKSIQSLVNNLIAAGVPINGVGIQMHINKSTSNTNISMVLDSMLATGLLIHIAELDVAANPESNQNLNCNTTVQNQLFDKYKFITRIVRNIPANQFYGITTWNVTDRDSWIPDYYKRPDFPLPFDSNYEKKIAYQGIMDGAINNWNFSASNCQSVSGKYEDLGGNGNAITTNFSGDAITYDDDNSSVQDIGFNFLFNGSVYSKFVLNTNGYIKLGSAPATANYFYTLYNGSTSGSTITESDIDMIYPFDHDLKAGTGMPEYRVFTNGANGSRVCTIQFKNVADKPGPVQISNMNFQIKLYESTGIIEFVYGTWTGSTNDATAITATCGIKGINKTESVNVAKYSYDPWNANMTSASSYNFITGNYLPVPAPQFGVRNTAMPDVGRTFRFIPSSMPVSSRSATIKRNTIAKWSLFSLNRF